MLVKVVLSPRFKGFTVMKIYSVLALMLIAFAPNVFAEDSEPVCAMVAPCNADGSVFAPFDDGVCAVYYAKMCARKTTDSLLNQLGQCGSSSAALEAKLTSREKRIKRLSRALRRSKTRR